MFAAYIRYADGTLETAQSLEDFAARWPRGDAFCWVDLEDPTAADLEKLDRIIDLDDAALEDCLSGEQLPRVDEYEEYLFLVLYGALGTTEEEEEFLPRKLAAFCGSQFLVTVHRLPHRTINSLRDRCAKHGSQILQRGVDFLLYTMIDMMVDNYVLMAQSYEERIEALENESYRADVSGDFLSELIDLRREMLELRQLAVLQRELLSPLAMGEYDYIAETLGMRLRHVRDHLVQVIDLVDRQRELLNGVRDNYHTTLALRANDVMKTLTVFAAILLPLTFIVGLYGMNLPLWPNPRSPASFWSIVALMALIAVGELVYFWWKKWL